MKHGYLHLALPEMAVPIPTTRLGIRVLPISSLVTHVNSKWQKDQILPPSYVDGTGKHDLPLH
jgi:hypothetical protein